MDDVSPLPLARFETLEALDAMARMAVAEMQDAQMETNDLDGLQALHAREGVTSEDLSALAGMTPPQSPPQPNTLLSLFMTGGELRRLRSAVGLSQRDLAQALGYSNNAIYWWEKQDSVIPRQARAHIIETLMDARRELEAQREQRALMLQWTPMPARDKRSSNTRPRRNNRVTDS